MKRERQHEDDFVRTSLVFPRSLLKRAKNLGLNVSKISRAAVARVVKAENDKWNRPLRLDL